MSAVSGKRKKAIDQILRSKKKSDRTIKAIVQSVSAEVQPKKRKKWSVRIIRGDIADMRRKGAPIEPKKHSDFFRATKEFYYYGYSDPTYRWESAAAVPKHLLPLQTACAFLSPYKNIEPVEQLIAYTKKVEREVPEALPNRKIPVYFSPLAENQVKPKVWNAALSAATNRRMLAITYTGWKGQSAKKPRRIAPYAIVQLEGEWYIYGTAQLLDDAPRQYKMSRILSAKETMASFEIPENMDMKKILSDSFGQFICIDDLQEITVRFKKEVAMLVREKQWQAQQKVCEHKNGEVTITFPVSKAGSWPYYHALRWILSWGSDAEVLEPPELKKLVAEEVKKMAK